MMTALEMLPGQIDTGAELESRGPIGVSPMPYGGFCAVYSDTYDGAPDSDCPIGFGDTEQASLEDLELKLGDSE